MSATEDIVETEARLGEGFLDRRPFKGCGITWWHLAVAALVVLIAFTRLWDLGSRGYSHDESIHAWEAWKLATGQGYKHNPVYHGPLLYHYTALIFTLFGDTDFTARLGTSLVGIAIAIMPLFFQRWLGKKGALAAMALVAISPVMMARSRFIRHDHFAVLFNLVLLLAILRYLTYRRPRDLYLVAASTSLSLTAKETTFITFFVFGTFLFGYWLYHYYWDRTLTLRAMLRLPAFDLIVVIGTLILPFATAFPIALLGGDPVDYQTGLAWKVAVFVAMLGASVAIGLAWNRRRWPVLAGIFWGICLPLFTTMFTNPVEGVATGVVGQLAYWLSQHGVARGGQPWYYYLMLLSLYEFLPALVGLGGAVFYGLRRDAAEGEYSEIPGLNLPRVPFGLILIYWFVVALVVYSWAGEKMPWLTMHLVAPLHMLAGWSLARLVEADWSAIRARHGLWILLIGPWFLYLLARVATTEVIPGTTLIAQRRWLGLLVTLLGLGILGGLLARLLARLERREAWRMCGLALVVILSVLTLRFAWMASFTNANYATEFLVYAHGTPDTALVARELADMSRRLTGGLQLKVAYDDKSSWPFEWYLRNFDQRYYYGNSPGAPFDADVVIMGVENEPTNRAFLGNRYYRREYRLIWWPNQDFYFGLTPEKIIQDLRNPAKRQEIWNIVFNRQHPRSPDDWYLVAKFYLYVRRDIAAQLWDYGPEVLAAAEPLPGDEYVEKWRSLEATAAWGADLSLPKGLAFDAQGNLNVADSGNNRVQVLDSSGTAVSHFGGEGVEPGEFAEPWGVAVAPDGTIYVADTWNHRLQAFDAEGHFLRTWGSYGMVEATGSGHLMYGPRDVVVDEQGYVYVSDTGNKRIIKYDGEGNVVAIAGGDGSGRGQFREPVGLALGPDGSLYVADTWNQRIQVLDKDLNYLREWPVYAWDGGSALNKPYLAVDDKGNVYASDPEGHRILEYDREGGLLLAWGSFGDDLACMNLPTGVEVAMDGRVLVSDSGNNRVLVFTAPG